jgi:hypothetical protein
MSGKRDKTPDPKGVAFMHVRPSETEGTHLAHWPPPRYEREAKPIMIKHAPNETAHRAKPRGWRLTRAIFAEFADDEE